MSIDSVGSGSVYEESFSEEDLKRIESLGIEWQGRSVVEVYDDIRIQVILTAAITYFQTAQKHPEQLPKIKAEIIDFVSDVFCEDEDDDIDGSNPFYQYDPVSGTYHRLVAVERIHLGKAWHKVKEKTKKIGKKAEHAARKAKHAVVKAVDKTKEVVGNAVDWAKEHGSANVQGPSTHYGPPESSKGHSKPSDPPPTPKSNSPLAQRQPDFIQKPSLTPQNTPPIALPKGMPQNHYDPNPYQQSGYPHRNFDLKPGAGHFSPPNLPTGHVPQHYIAPSIKPGEEPSVQQVIGTQNRAVDLDPSKLDEEKLKKEEEDLASIRAMNTIPANDNSIPNPGGLYKIGSAAAEGSLIGTQQQNTQLQESSWIDRLDKTAHELGVEAQSRLAHNLWKGATYTGKAVAAVGDVALKVAKPIIPDSDLQEMTTLTETAQRSTTAGHEKIDEIFGTDLAREYDPAKQGESRRLVLAEAPGGGLAGKLALIEKIGEAARIQNVAKTAGIFAEEAVVIEEAVLANKQLTTLEKVGTLENRVGNVIQNTLASENIAFNPIRVQSNGIWEIKGKSIKRFDLNKSLDSNKVNHLFNKSEHNLDKLQLTPKATYEKITEAVVEADLNGKIPIDRPFSIRTIINGHEIEVRGMIIDGELNYGTIFIPEK